MKMKNTSIKTRVTLYYAAVLILITLILFTAFYFTAVRQMNVVSRDTVMKAVQNTFDDIEAGDGFIEIDSDFDAYRKGVTLLVYSESGKVIKGTIPKNFPAQTPLEAGNYEEITGEDDVWLVYDLYNTYENGEGIWVRGIYAMDNAMQTFHAVIWIMLIALPAILLLAILAGRHITRQAFTPVSKITETANSINSGRDLSKRLPQGESKDELYDLTETLNLMIGRLEEAFQAEKQFSSDVSHELKTPVAVIMAECEYTLQKIRQPEEYQESLMTIQSQCRRTISLIQQLLQLTRTIDKDRSVEKEAFNLSILCESIAEEISVLAAEKGITMKTDIQADVNLTGDETLIMRMILNLLTNGIKYSKNSNTDEEDRWVSLRLKEKNNRIIIDVEDNGIGIKEEELENIFHRFYKVDKSRAGEDDSFGLGLSMVRWIAQAHGGIVSVQSSFGKGSRFTVELP
ncbi:ATP-binding protein [Ihubacter sp. mB4P-1]|uniref:HAMP domain-containing sensor histidine kinase n=1 Tax=Ihubacter sp. mB4P-1 TaxID=3242370 RepID=UPI00137A8296